MYRISMYKEEENDESYLSLSAGMAFSAQFMIDILKGKFMINF